jgi:tetratricopeptide (TPR) repeat protein
MTARGRLVTGILVTVGLASFVGASLVASRSSRNVATTSPEAYAYYRQGMEANNKHYFTDAVRAWKKATEIDSSFAMAWARLASYSAGLGDDEEANAYYDKAVSRLDRVSGREALLIRIIGAGIRGNAADRESLVTRLITAYPDDPEALLRSASRAAGRGDYQAAVADYRRLLVLDPRQGEAYNRMGYVLAREGKWAEATEAFQKYAFLYPDEPNPHDSLGELYLRTGRYADALKEFGRALEVKPDFIWARDHRAMVYADLGRYREALEETHRIETTLDGTLNDYAWRLYDVQLVFESGDPDRAVSTARELGPSHLKDPDLHQLLGRIYAASGHVRSAEAELKILTALQEERRREKGRDPAEAAESFLVLELRGDIAGAAGRWSEAADLYQQAAGKDTWSWWRARRASEKRVQALVRAGRFRDAAAAGGEILARNPFDAAANFWLAKALDASGKHAQAEVHYRRVLQTLERADPGNPLRAEASERAGALAESAGR